MSIFWTGEPEAWRDEDLAAERELDVYRPAAIVAARRAAAMQIVVAIWTDGAGTYQARCTRAGCWVGPWRRKESKAVEDAKAHRHPPLSTAVVVAEARTPECNEEGDCKRCADGPAIAFCVPCDRPLFASNDRRYARGCDCPRVELCDHEQQHLDAGHELRDAVA